MIAPLLMAEQDERSSLKLSVGPGNDVTKNDCDRSVPPPPRFNMEDGLSLSGHRHLRLAYR